jgi:hypothetical protein
MPLMSRRPCMHRSAANRATPSFTPVLLPRSQALCPPQKHKASITPAKTPKEQALAEVEDEEELADFQGHGGPGAPTPERRALLGK